MNPKFDIFFKRYPQDIRPMGVNNLNQLVHHHLGSESFDVVREVGQNMYWLHEIYHKLHLIAPLANEAPHLHEVGKHMRLLGEVHYHLPILRDIHKHLTKLLEEGKDIKDLNQKLDTVGKNLEKLQAHILVNDLIELALKEQTEQAKLNAQNAIQQSIKLGNNELNNLNKLASIITPINTGSNP